MPHASAASGLTVGSGGGQRGREGEGGGVLIVDCAPLSTNAFIGCPFTSTGMLRTVSASPPRRRRARARDTH